jgi:hypothetical protein
MISQAVLVSYEFRMYAWLCFCLIVLKNDMI